jgi:dihydroorotase
MSNIEILQPDDWHLHLRDGDFLNTTVPATARTFARAIVMPNLKPAVTTVELTTQYYARIQKAIPPELKFQPLMTLYLTDNTTADEIQRAVESDLIFGVKLYPAGATTHSDAGVTDIHKVMPLLEKMADHGLPLLIHGEVTDAHVDIFDREKVFIEQTLSFLTQECPQLKIVLEHITTKDAVDFIKNSRENVAATITAHHLWFNRNQLLAGGVRPDYYCLPILKTEIDRQALVQAAISANPKFFLGTDSAPHALSQKYQACGCAGIYSAPFALEFYAQIFAQHNALDKLENFASVFGSRFYGLPINTNKIKLERSDISVPDQYPFGNEFVTPMWAGKKIEFKVVK